MDISQKNTENKKIPKIIHFFYDENLKLWQKNKTPHFRMCYMSWLLNLKGYKIKHWHPKTEEFKEMLKDSRFLREAYKIQGWAYVADYVRNYVLYKYGGIYLDTDVEILKNFDIFLNDKFFISIEGDILYGKNIAEPAVMGGVKGHNVFKNMLELYNNDDIFKLDNFMAPCAMGKILFDLTGFERIDFKNNIAGCNDLFDRNKHFASVKTYEQYTGMEIFENKDLNIKIYPCEYFCPAWEKFNEKSITNKTIAIHWKQSSWCGSKADRRKQLLLKRFAYKGFKRFLYDSTIEIRVLLYKNPIATKLKDYFIKILAKSHQQTK